MYETAFVTVPAIHLHVKIRTGLSFELIVIDHSELFDTMGESTLMKRVRYGGRELMLTSFLYLQ